MPELVAIELKAHIPARDFEVSKQFYQDIGFTLCWSNGGLALLHYGPHGEHGLPAFLLQDHYVKEFAENLQMHLHVSFHGLGLGSARTAQSGLSQPAATGRRRQLTEFPLSARLRHSG